MQPMVGCFSVGKWTCFLAECHKTTHLSADTDVGAVVVVVVAAAAGAGGVAGAAGEVDPTDGCLRPIG